MPRCVSRRGSRPTNCSYCMLASFGRMRSSVCATRARKSADRVRPPRFSATGPWSSFSVHSESSNPNQESGCAMVHVNYLAVLVAAVAVFVLGWLWYSPLLFFKPWMRLRGLDPVAAMAGAKMPGGKLVIEFARCIVLAYVIARFVALLGIFAPAIAAT